MAAVCDKQVRKGVQHSLHVKISVGPPRPFCNAIFRFDQNNGWNMILICQLASNQTNDALRHFLCECNEWRGQLLLRVNRGADFAHPLLNSRFPVVVDGNHLSKIGLCVAVIRTQ